ncbi:hypothetical protein COV05_04535 [Candidatus Uhrbacteria bacterium CG10_big_fil_rev_8_21_14_0_10_48_16]|uniref:Uncharacterized protein n=1 Tax=Candidatus Uhrbacteria bacterium CG10_big_fil_rev_8_21_14_0_10_48_16 TaxID=1975038 RepID=A0A2M8LG66_9BACT|nr:MAG: hypothetical protein COV05_04535 [Candidatus Uhrbacteria bacterium CG10_big_fil_rev_8_21_14_0_10_48_16]
MAKIFEAVAKAAFQRKIEEVSEPIIKQALTTGLDENQTAKMVVKAIMSIPGHRLVGHALFNEAGEFLSRHAGELWPGDNRPQIIALRQVLKTVGPGLVATSDATADVLEQIANDKIDGVITTQRSAPADRKADMDYVVVVPDHFGMEPFFPVKMSDTGSVLLTPQGAPRVLSRKFVTFAERWICDNPKKVIKTGGGRGQQGKTEEIAPTAPWQIYSFQDWLKLVEGGDEIGQDVVDALRSEFAPPKSWDEKVSPETWAVFRAYVRTRRASQNAGRSDWLDREDSEALVTRMMERQPTPHRVNQMVGMALFDRIKGGAQPGYLPDSAVQEFHDAIDIFLYGDQDKLSKILRAVRDVRRSASASGVSGLRVSIAVLWMTSVIWLPIVGATLLLFMSVLMFIQGVFTPVTGTTLYFGHTVDSKAVALWLTFGSGWVAYVPTWFFPIFQTATSFLNGLFPGLKTDWLSSVGRKIVAFALVVCSGMEFYAVALNLDPLFRVMILAGVSVTTGMQFARIDSGFRYKVEQSVESASWIITLVFGAFPLAIAYIYGAYLGNPTEGKAILDWATGSYSSVSGHWYGLLVLLALGALFAGWVLSRSELLPDMKSAVKNPARWVLTLVLALGVLLILSEAHRSGAIGCGATPTPLAPVKTITITTPPAPGGPSRAELCARADRGGLSKFACDDL